MKMQYLESLQAFVTTEIRIWDPSQPPNVYRPTYRALFITLSFLAHDGSHWHIDNFQILSPKKVWLLNRIGCWVIILNAILICSVLI